MRVSSGVGEEDVVIYLEADFKGEGEQGRRWWWCGCWF